MSSRLACLVSIFLLSPSAWADKQCAYLSDEGAVMQIDSIREAPAKYQSRVICANDRNSQIPKPEDVELSGAVKTANFISDIGPISARWPRTVEKCFGRDPHRAIADAAQTVNRALSSASFSPEVKNRRNQWELVFVDKETAFKEFPAAITLGGHPGFMIRPNRIYLVSDFIAPNCDSSQVADAFLTQVMLHEMGHVIEHLLLGGDFEPDRSRSEGFASWFEQYSSNYSRVIQRGVLQSHYRKLAAESLKTFPTPFEGTPYDYAKAALQFDAIVERRGIAGLMSVYAVMRRERVPFLTAVERAIRWNKKMLDQEMMNLVKEK